MDLTAEQKEAWLTRVRAQCEAGVRHIEQNGLKYRSIQIIRNEAPLLDATKRIRGAQARTEDISQLHIDVDEPLTPKDLVTLPYGEREAGLDSHVARLHSWVGMRIEMAASKRWGGTVKIVWHPPTITLSAPIDMEEPEEIKYKLHQIYIELNMEFAD